MFNPLNLVLQRVYVLQVNYKSGTSIPLSVLKYTISAETIEWTAAILYARPLRLNYNEVESVWLTKSYLQVRRFWYKWSK